MPFKTLKYALLMPSFQGTVTFTGGLFLYSLHLFNYNHLALETLLLLLITIFVFITSTLLNLKYYKKITGDKNIKQITSQYRNSTFIYVIGVLFIIGWYGIYLYVREFVYYLGSLELYIYFLFGDPLVIRATSNDITPSGIQLTYLAWLASSATILEVKKRNISSMYYVPVIITVVLNLLFIDRTRPTWMIYTFALPVFFTQFNQIRLGKILKVFFIGILFIVGIFIVFKIFTGKESVEGAFGETVLPYELQDLYFYITSGYAYFNELIVQDTNINYVPENTLYPLFKLLSYLNVVKDPPNQVLSFLNVGISFTNVGTMLQPYYQDGGFVYILIGVCVQSFILDYLGYLFLKNGNSFSVYGWANLCFTNFIGFFTPKLVTFPIWFILIICYILKVTLSKNK
jgi:oligosaccharide repeat unit polymerase